jgi:hypothetical protein
MKKDLSAEMGAKIAAWIGAIGMILGAAFILFFPKPSTKALFDTQERQEQQIQRDADKAQEDFKAAQAKVAALSWSGGAEQVGPGALQAMNALAAKFKVTLSGFRPARTSQASGLDLLPYSVTATGAYPDVVNFVQAIENPDNRLAVDSIQIASSEANGDQVIATIGITAYRVSQERKHV